MIVTDEAVEAFDAALRDYYRFADPETATDREGIRAALEAAAPQWQPIETAPKDGTRFIYCASVDAQHDLIAVGYFSEDVDFEHGIITHWQPLPAAPKVEENDAE